MQYFRYTYTLSRKLNEIKLILGKRKRKVEENEKINGIKYADFQVKECAVSGDCKKKERKI